LLPFSSVHNPFSSCQLSKNIKIKIYRTVILDVVLYGCEIWFVTLRKDHRLRESENWVLRRIFGPNRDEIIGWKKLHSEGLHRLYSLEILEQSVWGG
jgi:hypothetical protein